MVQRIEEFRAKLETRSFRPRKLACDCKVQRLHARTVNRVAANVSKCEGRGRCECRSVKPRISSMRTRSENRLAGHICADRIFSQHHAGVCGIAKNGNGQRESALYLVNRREVPIAREQIR